MKETIIEGDEKSLKLAREPVDARKHFVASLIPLLLIFSPKVCRLNQKSYII